MRSAPSRQEVRGTRELWAKENQVHDEAGVKAEPDHQASVNHGRILSLSWKHWKATDVSKRLSLTSKGKKTMRAQRCCLQWTRLEMVGTLVWSDISDGDTLTDSRSRNFCWKQSLVINWMRVQVAVGVKSAKLTLSWHVWKEWHCHLLRWKHWTA